MLFPSAMSCFPARITMPFVFVASSEKCGGRGTLTSSTSKGKYSLEGSPPPSEIRPWIQFIKAQYQIEDLGSIYLECRGILRRLSRVIATARLVAANSSSLGPRTGIPFSSCSPHSNGLWAISSDFSSHNICVVNKRTVPSLGFRFAMALIRGQCPIGAHRLKGVSRTGLLNMSLLACAATPPPIFGAFDRRAWTPLTLSWSEKVVACVSATPWGSIAEGDICYRCLKSTENEKRCQKRRVDRNIRDRQSVE